MFGLEQATAAALCSAALLVSGYSTGEAATAQRSAFQVMVLDCYRGSAAEVLVDGRPLVLTPPAQRDDTIGVCYNRSAALGPRVQVRVRSQGRDQLIKLISDSEKRFLLISLGHAPYAKFSRKAPLLD